MFKFLFYANNQLDFRAAIAMVMSVIAGFSESTLVLVINNAAQYVIQDSIPSALKLIPLFLFIFIILLILKRQALQLCAQLVEDNLEIYRNRIANQLRQSSLLTVEQIAQGEIYTKLTIDTKKISRTSVSFILVIQSSITILLIIIYMFSISRLGTSIFLFYMGFAYCYSQLHYQSFVETIDEMTGKETELFEKVGHIFDGFKELKMNPVKNEDFFHNHLKPLSTQVKILRKLIGKRIVVLYGVNYYLLFYITFGTIVFALPQDYTAALRFKIFVMAAFMTEPVKVFLKAIPELLASLVSIERLNTLEQKFQLSESARDYISKPDKPIVSLVNQIQLESLQFKYKNKDDIVEFEIGPINLDIQIGTINFLVGGNGSGKSTLLKLMTGLYPMNSGAIYFDDQKIDISQYRHLFSVVFSDCYIFDGMYGFNNINAQRINELLQLMEIDRHVKWQNQKFQYSGLSTGQKKRLAFVYLMLEDARIYILDEWAAEQDPVFKNKFYSQILPMLKKEGKTIIAATHDDQYFHLADQLVKLDYGQIVKA
jgi:putative ATP-binding cassette transporter